MKSTCRRQWLFLSAAAALTFCADRAADADDSNYGLPVTQVQFDKLIPMSYPTTSPGYDRLRQTIWPLIDPGVAKIPTTENLVYPTDQPLLITNEGGLGQSPQNRPKQVPAPIIQHSAESSHAPAHSGGKTP